MDLQEDQSNNKLSWKSIKDSLKNDDQSSSISFENVTKCFLFLSNFHLKGEIHQILRIKTIKMGTRLCTCSNSNDDHILLDPETSNEDWIPKGDFKKND